MARQNWSIFKWIDSAWVADGTVYRANNDVTLGRTSNQSKIQLADGSERRITPSTKFVRDPTNFTWLEIDFDDTLKIPYDLAKNCIRKKPPFAIEILLNSKTDDITKKDFSNWKIPDYIYQGLLWLKKD